MAAVHATDRHTCNGYSAEQLLIRRTVHSIPSSPRFFVLRAMAAKRLILAFGTEPPGTIEQTIAHCRACQHLYLVTRTGSLISSWQIGRGSQHALLARIVNLPDRRGNRYP